MDGLSAAASLIAVIEISAKIASLCFQYSSAVKDARKDIERLERKVADLKGVLGGVKQLLDERDKSRLSAAGELAGSLNDCFLRLERLKTQLDPENTHKAMSRLGVRALKWPFTSKEVEKIVDDLERYKQTFILALQVDQTGLILDFDQKVDFVDKKIDMAKLPIAKGASFDSHMEEHNARCLRNTRVELQRYISEWAKDTNSKPVFWLNGMAGTGKSTIARTVAQSFADKGQLGASFFFKKGERDRGNAARFFTTIATDLMGHVPGLIPGIRKAIDDDSAISKKALKDQFEKLILQPFLKMKETSQFLQLVVVIDALDECDREEDIRAILQLFGRIKDIPPVSLRVFLTSRPELPIRLGFKKMSSGTYQDLILHEVPKQTIKQDIALFLENEFGEIREQRSLSPSWPSKDQIQALVEMAIPLFIFAATASRYIGDIRGNPKKRLDTVLQYQTAPQISKLDKTYLPILNQLFDDEDEVDRKERTSEFREIVGSIVILESPLSVVSHAHLLGIPKEDIGCRLDSLHSVLNIPVDENLPVRLLHLSFRDFLFDPQKQEKSPFWVDKRETHEKVTSKCLQLMSSPKGLRQNICNLSRPGTLQSEINDSTIDRCLQPEVRYACRYWVHHLKQSKGRINDGSPVYAFLHKYFLYWLEAMSLMKEASESIRMITSLQLLMDSDNSAKVLDFLCDAKRFALQNRSMLEEAPLQLYSSALIFAPEMSIIRQRFNGHIPSWTTRLTKVETDWNASLQTLEGHSRRIRAVAFSPVSQLLASGSEDATVRLWDVATGSCHSILERHSSWVTAVAFSPDGQLIASASVQIRLEDVATGSCRSTLKGHSGGVCSLAFSPDGQLIASGSEDCTVRLWDAATGSCRGTLKGHSRSVSAVTFLPGGQLIASASRDATVRLWDAATGSCRGTLRVKGRLLRVFPVAFSSDGQLIASGSDSLVIVPGSDDTTIRLWDAATGSCRGTLKGHSLGVCSLAFSPDGQLIASGSEDCTVRLWDAAMESCLSILEAHAGWAQALAFSPGGQLLASGFNDCTIRLWEVTTGSCLSTFNGHSNRVISVAFAPDGQLIASGSNDSTVRLWDAATGSCRGTLKGHSRRVCSVAFSLDGQLIASGSEDDTVRLWDAATGSCRSTLKGHSRQIRALSFSPDGQLIASGAEDHTVRLWDTTTGSCHKTLKINSHSRDISIINSIAFSPDGQLIASASTHAIRVWDAATRSYRGMLRSDSVFSVDAIVRLWDVATGICRSTIETTAVRAIAFSSDGSLITTNQGQVSLPSLLTSSKPKTGLWPIYVKDQWVTSAEQRLLWLPKEYRPTSTASWENIICMGHASGHVTILKFNLERLPQQNKPIVIEWHQQVSPVAFRREGIDGLRGTALTV